MKPTRTLHHERAAGERADAGVRERHFERHLLGFARVLVDGLELRAAAAHAPRGGRLDREDRLVAADAVERTATGQPDTEICVFCLITLPFWPVMVVGITSVGLQRLPIDGQRRVGVLWRGSFRTSTPARPAGRRSSWW